MAHSFHGLGLATPDTITSESPRKRSLLGAKVTFIALAAATLVLAACGGGGGGGGATTTEPGPNVFTNDGGGDITALSNSFGRSGGNADGDSGADGTGGDGGAIRNATVVLTCAGSTTEYTGATNDNGKYFIRFNRATCAAPYLVRIIDTGGNTYASMGVETPNTGKVVTLNITPLTDKVVSDVVQPLGLGGTSQNFSAGSITAVLSGNALFAKVDAAKTDLRTSISAALVAAGATSSAGFDPVKSNHAFNGTGVDAILESIAHSRDPQTGRTILRAKLVSIGSETLPTLSEITAAAPLAPTNLNGPASPSLNFTKLAAWVDEVNFCLSQAPGTVNNRCENKLISDSYKNNSRGFDQEFGTLLSETNCGTNGPNCGVQGSTFRNPTLLYTGNYPGSTATFNDLAVVEVTIRQPKIGTFNNAGFNGPVEYTQFLIFKRDDSAPGLIAGNWVLYGNQRNFNISVTPRFEKFTQLNPARQANTNATTTFTATNGTATSSLTQSLNSPSFYGASLRINIDTSRYDMASKTYVSANIRAVKVTGPGLPPAGLVMAPNGANVCGGNTQLGIQNTTGTLPVGAAAFTAVSRGNRYRLAAVLQSDTNQATYWMGGTDVSRNTGNVTDFSGLPAYSRYRFDIVLNDGSTATEYSRILSPVTAPAQLAAAQWNDISPSAAGLTPAALATPLATANVSWVNNPNAAFVDLAAFDSEAYAQSSSSVSQWTASDFVNGAASVAGRPSSQTVQFPADSACTFGSQFPKITQARENRNYTVRAWQGRAYTFNTVGWTN